MKKLLYTILIMNALGFTVAPTAPPAENTRKKRIVNNSASRAGYLEVYSPGSYSLTAGS